MKIVYLLPPSEGKIMGGIDKSESLSFDFKKPLEIAVNATQKDLKCKDARYEQGIQLNKNVENSQVLPAIERYSGVMYNAIDYKGMSALGKKYFEENFIILSGMFGLVRPLDKIGNYKLPVETKGLYNFWGGSISKRLDELNADYIVDMLPGSYAKMVNFKNVKTKVIRVNFLHTKNGELKKITHGVKKVKGEYIKNICEHGFTDITKISTKSLDIDVICD